MVFGRGRKAKQEQLTDAGEDRRRPPEARRGGRSRTGRSPDRSLRRLGDREPGRLCGPRRAADRPPGRPSAPAGGRGGHPAGRRRHHGPGGFEPPAAGVRRAPVRRPLGRNPRTDRRSRSAARAARSRKSRAASAPNSSPSCPQAARTAARDTVWHASSASTARAGSSAASSAGRRPLDRDAAAALEGLFRQIVVVRGENPMPPRDLLQLRLPKDTAVPAPRGRPRPRATRAWTGDHPDWLMPPARRQPPPLSIRELPERGRVLVPRLHRVRHLRAGQPGGRLHRHRRGPRRPAPRKAQIAGRTAASRAPSARRTVCGSSGWAGAASPESAPVPELRLEGMVTVRDGLPTMFNPRYEILSRQEEQ